MNNIYIFTQYNSESSGRCLASPPAGITYVRYLVNSLKSIGYKVVIVSVSGGVGNSYYKTKKTLADSLEENIYLPTINEKGSVIRLRCSQLFMYIQVFLFLIVHTRRKDKILIYHDYGLSTIFSFFRKIIKRNYFIIAAEIFSAVYQRGMDAIQKEIKTLQGALGYIFINNEMPKYFENTTNYCVSHGSYEIPSNFETNSNLAKINVVYAGKIDSVSITDAFLAVESAMYLDQRYCLNVLGYGSSSDIEKLKSTISHINRVKGFDVAKYGGCLFGEEYDKFLFDCQIGLCTRTLAAPYSDFCFPSKTIVYLTHGLHTICPDSQSIRNSDISGLVHYFEGDLSPESIADAILKVELSENNNINKIRDIDAKFCNNLQRMLNAKKLN